VDAPTGGLGEDFRKTMSMWMILRTVAGSIGHTWLEESRDHRLPPSREKNTAARGCSHAPPARTPRTQGCQDLPSGLKRQTFILRRADAR
jgi:hypothetical protein